MAHNKKIVKVPVKVVPKMPKGPVVDTTFDNFQNDVQNDDVDQGESKPRAKILMCKYGRFCRERTNGCKFEHKCQFGKHCSHLKEEKGCHYFHAFKRNIVRKNPDAKEFLEDVAAFRVLAKKLESLAIKINDSEHILAVTEKAISNALRNILRDVLAKNSVDSIETVLSEKNPMLAKNSVNMETIASTDYRLFETTFYQGENEVLTMEFGVYDLYGKNPYFSVDDFVEDGESKGVTQEHAEITDVLKNMTGSFIFYDIQEVFADVRILTKLAYGVPRS